MSVKPLPAPGVNPRPVQGFLHPWGRLSLRLSSFLSRLTSHVSHLTVFLLLCSPSAVHAQPIWGPDVQLTNYPNGTAYHPKIAVCQDTLHVVWYQQWSDTIFHEEVMYKRSTDRGQSWASDTILSPLAPGASKTPVITVSGTVVHVAWFEETGDSVLYIRSTDCGRSWNGMRTLTPAGFVPDMGVSGDTVLVYWGTTTTSNLSMSTDAGLTWQAARLLPRGRADIEDRLAVSWPLLHIVCEQDTAIPPILEVYNQRSNDGGQTWSLPVMISERDLYAGQWPEVFADRSSNPHVVWFDYKYSPYAWTGDIFYRTSLDTGIIWEPIDSLTVEHRATASDIVGLGDTLHLVWEDERFNPVRRYGEIYYRFSSDRGTTWGPETRLTYDSLDSRTPQLAVSSSGIYLVWGDKRVPDSLIYYNYEVFFKKGTYNSGVEVQKEGYSLSRDFNILPNPTTGQVKCHYAFLRPTGFALEVFDVVGRRVWKTKGQGKKGIIVWDGRNEQGIEVRSGVYFVRLKAGDSVYQQKVTILKRR